MFNVDRVSSFRSAVSTQRFVDAFKKQASSRYRLKNWPVLQVANPGLILFATGPPDLGKIQLGYPERLSCSTSDFEPLTFVIDHEHEFVIRGWVILSSFNASPARTIRASSFLLLPSAPPCRAVALCEGGCSLPCLVAVVSLSCPGVTPDIGAAYSSQRY